MNIFGWNKPGPATTDPTITAPFGPPPLPKPAVYNGGVGSTGLQYPSLPTSDQIFQRNGGQWAKVDNQIDPSNEIYIQGMEGQIKALTMIVSENNTYLLDQISIEHGPVDTYVNIPIIGEGKDETFTIPRGDLTHSLAKKYLDWLAMMQLVLQGGNNG